MPADSYKRVLVVDDDADIRGMLASLLRQHSLHVDEAQSGEEAVEILREHHYSVVLLDLIMRNGDGFSVLDAINADAMRTPPVVLVLTGADREIVARLDPQRIHGVVRKPFDAEDLASLVVACAEVKSRGSLETMALAVISSAPILDLLRRLGG